MVLRRCSLVAGLAIALGASSFAVAQECAPKTDEAAKAETAPKTEGVPKAEELFQSLDKNSDGKLTADEVSSEQKRFFERTIRVGDKDADGALTKEEFVAANREPENPSQPLAPIGGGRDGMGDPKQRFEMMDRNKDGKVTLDEIPEQFRDRVKPMFDRLGKEAVTLEEFTQIAGRLGGQGGPPEPGQLFARFDRNGDGKLTKDEIPEPMRERMNRAFEALGKEELTREDFAEVARRMLAEGGRPGPDGRPGPMGPDGPRGRGPALFGMLDTDRDGLLSKDELAKVVDRFSELDKNQDGKLDPPELFGPPPGGPEMAGGPDMRRPEGGRPGQPGGPNPFFARMDANGDGKISKEEAPDRMKEGFARMDKDGDGFLTQEELRQMFEGRGPRPEGGRPPGEPGAPESGRPRRPPAE